MSFADEKSLENKDAAVQHIVAKFEGFGFWVESVFQIERILSYMQQAVDIAKDNGYTVVKVSVFGGVHEVDTGYESFSGKTYCSFEDAKENLSTDFEEEEAQLDGLWLRILNFDSLVVEMLKDDKLFRLSFSRGELSATEGLHEILTDIDWKSEDFNTETILGEKIFEGCNNLNDVNFHEDNNKDFIIEDGLLRKYNGSSADVIIPEGVKFIGNFVFDGFERLTSITIPDSVTSLGACVFRGCTGLTTITIPDSITSIGNGAFYNTGCYDNSGNWENGVFYIDNCLIKADSSISGSYTVKNGTKVIADNAFDSCIKVTSITIPDSVTNIGHHAFQNCTNLVSVTIGNSVTHIGTQSFKGCVSLSSATIPDSAVIGFEAFYDYWKLKGLCTFCGGKIKGLFNKKCSRCGISKIVMDSSEFNIKVEDLLKE